MQYSLISSIKVPWFATLGVSDILRGRVEAYLPLQHKPTSYTITVTFRGYYEKDWAWRFAKLTIRPDLKFNIISQRLVIEVLDVQFERTRAQTAGYFHGEELVTIGHVDLQWQPHQSVNACCGPTRFEVTEDRDPPFDAILGYEDSSRHNLLREGR